MYLRSLPSRERGLKFFVPEDGFLNNKSLPSRERGLKSLLEYNIIRNYLVAPLAGAWIEIHFFRVNIRWEVSLPSRERGLK